MTEMKCTECGETFVVSDAEIGDMSLAGVGVEHYQKEGGGRCGGVGKPTGSWS